MASTLAISGAVVRIGGTDPRVAISDNFLPKAVREGSGTYVFAAACGFQVDPCRPARGQDKGKVERQVRTERSAFADLLGRDWPHWAALHERATELHARRQCPVTGTHVAAAFAEERRALQPVPALEEPFDIVVARRVARDCLVGFEGRRYSVPFPGWATPWRSSGRRHPTNVVHTSWRAGNAQDSVPQNQDARDRGGPRDTPRQCVYPIGRGETERPASSMTQPFVRRLGESSCSGQGSSGALTLEGSAETTGNSKPFDQDRCSSGFAWRRLSYCRPPHALLD